MVYNVFGSTKTGSKFFEIINSAASCHVESIIQLEVWLLVIFAGVKRSISFGILKSENQ